MSIIKSPFNFVPLSGKVFFPDWAGKISQDIPFSDGLSGMIRLKITADSPIYIRNGHVREDAPDKKTGEFKTKEAEKRYISFSHVDVGGEPCYFIPGTSIKGEVRNLLEIMSFGKMQVDRSAMFARRDLTRNADYPLKNHQREIHCGWLRRNGDAFEVTDNGRPYRMSHKSIDSWTGKELMARNFSAVRGIDLTKNTTLNGKTYDPKTAAYKKALLGQWGLDRLSFSIVKEGKTGDKYVEVDDNGDIQGSIVVTGQPGPWKMPRGSKAGKFYEFVFGYEEQHSPRRLSREMFSHFEFIYRDSTDWNDVKKNIDHQGIPVFFRANGNDIIDFGLTFLYKMPYRHSVQDSLPGMHRDSRPDLAQCIFGYTEADVVKDDSLNSLKGRVQFGNAFELKAEPDAPLSIVQGSPKASYYPIYVHQDGRNGVVQSYMTYDSGRPAGWKRYHIRKDTWPMKTGSEKLDTTICPLRAGAEFWETITFHNLRPVELGALLSALTFHGQKQCHHQLGLAKSYGFGVCTYGQPELKAVALADPSQPAITDIDRFLAVFELTMDKEMGMKWSKSSQITELLSMAADEVPDTEAYRYMLLTTTGLNEFNKVKENREYLLSALERGLIPVDVPTYSERFQQQMHKEQLNAERQLYLDAIARASASLNDLNTIRKELSDKYGKSLEHDVIDVYHELSSACEVSTSRLLETIAHPNVEIDTASGLSSFGLPTTSYKAFEGKLAKWLKSVKEQDGRDILLDDEVITAASVLQVICDKSKKKDMKQWLVPGGGFYKSACGKLGKENAEKLFGKLNIKKE